jgi:hypothetical protein
MECYKVSPPFHFILSLFDPPIPNTINRLLEDYFRNGTLVVYIQKADGRREKLLT